jgi:hypothetical protein
MIMGKINIVKPKSRPTTNAESMVTNDAPRKPSQVFLGDNLISGVRPKKNPHIYATMSLMTIKEAGNRNLKYNITKLI